MPDTLSQDATRLDADLNRADQHRRRADEFRRIAERRRRPEYWLNRASIAHALAIVIILGMKETRGC